METPEGLARRSYSDIKLPEDADTARAYQNMYVTIYRSAPDEDTRFARLALINETAQILNDTLEDPRQRDLCLRAFFLAETPLPAADPEPHRHAMLKGYNADTIRSYYQTAALRDQLDQMHRRQADTHQNIANAVAEASQTGQAVYLARTIAKMDILERVIAQTGVGHDVGLTQNAGLALARRQKVDEMLALVGRTTGLEALESRMVAYAIPQDARLPAATSAMSPFSSGGLFAARGSGTNTGFTN